MGRVTLEFFKNNFRIYQVEFDAKLEIMMFGCISLYVSGVREPKLVNQPFFPSPIDIRGS